MSNLSPLPQYDFDNDESFRPKEYVKPKRKFMTREKRLEILGRTGMEEVFNLDEYQLKKIQGIIERVAVRKKTSKDYDPSLTRGQIRMLQLEELVVEENETYKKKPRDIMRSRACYSICYSGGRNATATNAFPARIGCHSLS